MKLKFILILFLFGFVMYALPAKAVSISGFETAQSTISASKKKTKKVKRLKNNSKIKKKIEIFSLLSFIFSLFSIFVIPGILALIFGFIGLARLKKRPEQKGRKLAWMGIAIVSASVVGVLIGIGIHNLLAP